LCTTSYYNGHIMGNRDHIPVPTISSGIHAAPNAKPSEYQRAKGRSGKDAITHSGAKSLKGVT